MIDRPEPHDRFAGPDVFGLEECVSDELNQIPDALAMNAMYRYIITLSAAAIAIACSDIVFDEDGVARESRLAVIHYYSDSIFSLAPSEVAIGDSFAVSVRSYTEGCTTSGMTLKYASGLTGSIEPYDNYPVKKRDPDNICHLGVAYALHAARFAFQERGTATILIHGRREPGGARITGTKQIQIR